MLCKFIFYLWDTGTQIAETTIVQIYTIVGKKRDISAFIYTSLTKTNY